MNLPKSSEKVSRYITPTELVNEYIIKFDHNEEDIKKLDTWIKSYLEIENIPYIDLSKIDYKKRQDYVTKQILING